MISLETLNDCTQWKGKEIKNFFPYFIRLMRELNIPLKTVYFKGYLSLINSESYGARTVKYYGFSYQKDSSGSFLKITALGELKRVVRFLKKNHIRIENQDELDETIQKRENKLKSGKKTIRRSIVDKKYQIILDSIFHYGYVQGLISNKEVWEYIKELKNGRNPFKKPELLNTLKEKASSRNYDLTIEGLTKIEL